MPRVADHDLRREQIARAFQRLLAADGLARVTFARVAEEAGTSVGLIQHYFRNKEELIGLAYADCLTRIDARIAMHTRDGEENGEPISAMLLAGLRELLPLDDERMIEFRVERSLWNSALNDAGLTDIARQASAGTRRRLVNAVENGKKCGEVVTSVDASVAASTILAVTRGSADALALDVSSAGHADEVLRAVIASVFTGSCRHYDS
ncbi:TetR family transcriptional regulator [Nocardia cyriacigeorgica]|uniref:TetR family transcriptional regulator n=1 Tax=Nocardia cyriacigeorgica TaxID=135487 RepID=A0A6P1D2D5_9NOCA|nr:TetR/AcrR family transcriptional regulator [Nocardia cyriacigeorgica]NEW40926.1 TetR family transcriptional regulator [Nocardia cyriacigeorgica]NEW44735.1 TetR family transcriptional regulator [Nocardia cyriacigeorgica]NEW55603.1 TetR family transcriptional regulator [Nocardia cyriacigeorgica]